MGCSSSTEPTESTSPSQVPSVAPAVSATAHPKVSREAPHPLLPTSPVVRPCTGTRPSAFVLAPPVSQAPPAVLETHGSNGAPLIDFGYVQPPPAVSAPATLAQQRRVDTESSLPDIDGHVLLADAVGERSSVHTHARSTGSQRSDAVLGFRRSTGQSASATMCVADDNEPTLHPSFSRAARIVPIASDGAPSWHREVSPPAGGFAPTRTPHHAPHVGSSADSVSASTPPAAGAAAPPLAGCESMLLPPPATPHRAGAAHQAPNGLTAGAADAGVLRSLSPSDAVRVAAGAAAGALIAKGLWSYMRLRSAKGGRAAGTSSVEVSEKKTLPPKMPTSAASVGSASLGSAANLDQSPLRPPPSSSAAPPATVRRFRRPAPAARAAVPVSPADSGVSASGGGDFEDLGAWGDAASPVAPPVPTPQQRARATEPTGATTMCRLRDAAPAAGAQATAATFAQRGGGEGTAHEGVARLGRHRDVDNNNSFDHDDAPTEAPLRNAPGSEWMLVK